MLSVIIPSYKDALLGKTVDSLLENAEAPVEVLVVLDGYRLGAPLREDARVRVIGLDQHRGMRAAINAGLAEAKGDFVMKIDEHCLVGKGYDRVMAESCAHDWLVIPRRYALDVEGWRRNEAKPVQDYHYLSFPRQDNFGHGMAIGEWGSRTDERRDPKYDVDDTMTFQGSCWFANRGYFMGHVGLLDDRAEAYGTFVQEAQEIGLKYWLGGGEVKVNKKTWYAHLKKTKGYYSKNGWAGKSFKKDKDFTRNSVWSARHWINDEEPNMVRRFEWLVEKFWPVPTWPSGWQEIWKTYKV